MPAKPRLSPPPRPRAGLPLGTEDWRGVARLVVDGAVGVADTAEALQLAITDTVGRRGGPAVRPIADIVGRTARVVYRGVRGGMRGVGGGVDVALRLLADREPPVSTPERDAFVAALNGVFGDRLAAHGNPLALPTTLRVAGATLAADGSARPAETGRVLLLVHGLCMNDRQWTRNGHDHGRALARELGFTPVYARYNSGRHVSENGRELAFALETLLDAWPVPVDELVVVGHSMGGLVARSAAHAAGEAAMRWPSRLTRLVFLGTPHHGAPLERAGRLFEAGLALSRYLEPFARIGAARSAGITDLRWGNLRDADWQGRHHRDQRHDDRVPTPPPAGVALHAVAATLARRHGAAGSEALGDGLVPLASALGDHADPALALHVPAAHRLVVRGANHWDLLSHAGVHRQLRDWLGGR